MIRIALKNLWSQRRVYGWLALELTILSILAWVIIDPTAVRLYYANQPVGYDLDRLAEIYITTYPSTSPKYSATAADSITVSDNYDRIYSIVESWPGVESATVVYYEFDGGSSWNSSLFSETDTISASWHYYLRDTPFFSTYGIKPVDGKTMEKLQGLQLAYADIIISESAAEGIGMTPREVLGYYPYGDTFRIVGVTTNVRSRSVSPSNVTIFYPVNKQYIGVQNYTIVLRVKDGIDPARFVDENRKALNEKLSIGNYHPLYIRTYAEKSKEFRNSQGYTNANRIGIFMAAFFLVNMALGVVGTIWLQTRRRSGEAGIMKAFGARPRHIKSMLIWEGVILTATTWILGSVIYLQYALKSGLAQAEYTYMNNYPSSWVTDFWTHFGIVALIILVLMLIAVVIGIWIPAQRIAHVDPALTLKDE